MPYTTTKEITMHGQQPAPTASEYQVDPFGAAASDIRTACDKALAHEGSMSQGEYDRLLAIKALLA